MIRHFGVLIPSTNTTVEIEYNRLLPPSLQVHVGRLGKAVNTPFSPSRDEDIDYQSRMLEDRQDDRKGWSMLRHVHSTTERAWKRAHAYRVDPLRGKRVARNM